MLYRWSPSNRAVLMYIQILETDTKRGIRYSLYEIDILSLEIKSVRNWELIEQFRKRNKEKKRLLFLHCEPTCVVIRISDTFLMPSSPISCFISSYVFPSWKWRWEVKDSIPWGLTELDPNIYIGNDWVKWQIADSFTDNNEKFKQTKKVTNSVDILSHFQLYLVIVGFY